MSPRRHGKWLDKLEKQLYPTYGSESAARDAFDSGNRDFEAIDAGVYGRMFNQTPTTVIGGSQTSQSDSTGTQNESFRQGFQHIYDNGTTVDTRMVNNNGDEVEEQIVTAPNGEKFVNSTRNGKNSFEYVPAAVKFFGGGDLPYFKR